MADGADHAGGGGPGGRFRVEVHPDARAFLGRAEAWLREREDAHNLMLSLAYARTGTPAPDEEEVGGDGRGTVRAGGKDGQGGSEDGGVGDVLFGTVTEEGRVVGCVMRTPPHKLLLTDLPPEAADAVSGRVAERYDAIPAVLGPEPAAEEVARAWTRRRGGSVHPGMAQRIYRLDRVVPPQKAEGALRPARPAELEQAVAWGHAFAEEAGTQFATTQQTVERWIRRGELFVWDVAGAPRSIAVAGGRTPRGVRIGYVYTPPEARANGFASNLVAALSQRMLDDGRDFCVLYTDLANPTSNAIYRRVGYEPLMDVRDFEIRAEGGEA